MKLKVDKYPLLHAIQTGVFFDPEHPFSNWVEDDGRRDFAEAYYKIDRIWKDIVTRVRANVVYICDTYQDAIERSAPAFGKAFLKDSRLRSEFILNAGAGCLLMKHRPQGKADGTLTGLVYDFTDEHTFILLAHDCETLQNVFYQTDNGNAFSVVSNVEPDPNGCYGDLLHDVCLFWMMEKYARIETRICKPRQKIKISASRLDNLLNELTFSIKLRDSTWFTNIVRNEGFLVSGHFRLQPKKINGVWTREFIYIQEYQKHGYHRSARLLDALEIINAIEEADEEPDESAD